MSIAKQRGPLLHAAMCWFVQRTQPERVAALASDGSMDAQIIALDALGCEPQLTNDFLAQYSELACTPSERILVGVWETIPISLWNVVDTNPGRSFTIRKLTDDMTHEIMSDHMSEVLEPGSVVACRPIPMEVDADGVAQPGVKWRVFSGCSVVPDGWRQGFEEFAALSPSSVNLVEWLSLQALRDRNYQGGSSVIKNTDGENVLYATRRWMLGANRSSQVFGELDRLVDSPQPAQFKLLRESTVDPLSWAVTDSSVLEDRLVGQLQLSDDGCELMTNSLARLLSVHGWLTSEVGLTEEFVTQYESVEDRALAEDLGLRAPAE